MENFVAYNPTKLYFGKGVIDNLGNNIKKFGKKALIVIGKGSVKKYGYLELVINQLTNANIDFVIYEGIKPNPVIDDVYKAVELAKKNNVEFFIALGGGSVIDSTKIINLAYSNDLDPWDIMKYKAEPTQAKPLIVILTLAATGSEMNGAAVLQNHNTLEKIGYVSELNYPTEAYLDPSFTITVPKNQTVNGIVDLIAHSLEAFFAYGDAPLSDRFVAQVILEAMEFSPKLLNDLQNYDLRARMMWTATVALNGTLYRGRLTTGDWGVHAIGHTISMLYDTPHGQTLSIAYPAWLKHFKSKIPHRIAQLAKLLTGRYYASADDAIELLENFFSSIGAPTRLNHIGLTDQDKTKILNLMIKNKISGLNHKMEKEDYERILSFM